MNLAMVMAMESRIVLDHTQYGDLLTEAGRKEYLRKMRQPPKHKKDLVLHRSPFRPFCFPETKSTRQ